MPRFFFDLLAQDGSVTVDCDGGEFASLAAARADAERGMVEMSAERFTENQPIDFDGIVLRDHDRQLIETIRSPLRAVGNDRKPAGRTNDQSAAASGDLSSSEQQKLGMGEDEKPTK